MISFHIRLLDAMTSGVGCEECYDLVYVDVMALSALPHEIHRAYRYDRPTSMTYASRYDMHVTRYVKYISHITLIRHNYVVI